MSTMIQNVELAKAGLYQQLAMGFAYPTADRRPQLPDLEELAEFVQIVVDNARQGESLRSESGYTRRQGIEHTNEKDSALSSPRPITLSLDEAMERFRDAALTRDDLEGEYTFLFARKVQVPLYASRYLPTGAYGQPRALADASSFYRAFGFDAVGELADHIGTQLEFLGLLCLKETYAREQGWVEHAETCLDARRQFIGDHVLIWLPALVQRMHERARLPFYTALVDLVAAFIQLECEELKVQPSQYAPGTIEPERTQLEDEHNCPVPIQ